MSKSRVVAVLGYCQPGCVPTGEIRIAYPITGLLDLVADQPALAAREDDRNSILQP